MKKILISLVLLGLIGWGVYDLYFQEKKAPSKPTQVQQKQPAPATTEFPNEQLPLAPDFTLKTLEGKEVTLSELRGKKVMLNFWATWCPPCRAEMPDMEKFYKEYKGKNVEILAINFTTAEKSHKDVEKFVKEFGLTFPVVLDEKNIVNDIYQPQGIPNSFFIDSKGVAQYHIIGPMTYDSLVERINSID
ncbi:TlpA disulfide reductase family protein [Hazenella coriacea]|uniref:Peroxiredoxin n=1 Tax=Hazenella coriacea TaxID=1179467 RepID=A0A4R3L6W1_9BACL|nr:TlpA family protein disulfide reductase [Hazenella coriacea]TCS94828.1 peroxiredoxin [Hazenella coriacea]